MRRVIPALVAVVGAVLAGVGVWFSADHHAVTFGWTAYAPLTATTFHPYIGPPIWATAAIVVGCLAVGSAVAVLVVGMRSR